MLSKYALYFAVTFGLALILTPLVGILADKWNVVDIPRGRHQHEKVTPKLGGIAIFFSLTVVAFFALELNTDLWSILGTGFVFLLLGIMDDAWNLSPWTKLYGQLAGAIILTIGGIEIGFVGNPFTTAIFSLGSWAAILTVLWIVGIINAVNWSDGVDGSVSGISLISCLVLAALSYNTGHTTPAVLATILAGALGGFLVYNFYPAKIFLGDSGSMVIGYFLALLGFLGGAKIATALILLGIPLFDFGFTILFRLLHKKPIYVGDNNHLHHRLQQIGFSHIKIALLLYLASAVLGGSALFFSGTQKVATLIVLLVLYAIGWTWLLKQKDQTKV